ncbi:outer membrane lipoprotein carrier protein LolA [Candidatus Poribacteria bacterium]|nr:outer membrane lipoprotein carrier protein LolA [Candidatus Poribacteria bacterium]
MKALRKVLAFVFVLVLASAAFAQTDSKTQQMIDEVTQKAKAVNSYRADIKMEMAMQGEKMVSSGTMAFKRPDKVHMVTTMAMPSMPEMPPGMPGMPPGMSGGMKQEMYGSGDVLWNYMPASRMAHKVDLAKVRKQYPQAPVAQPEDPSRPFDAFLKDKIKFVEKKTVEGKSVYVFEGDISQAATRMSGGQMGPHESPSRIAVWLNSDTGLPNKMFVYDMSNKLMMTHAYTNYKINVPINDSEFLFAPPAGVQIMDNTQSMIDSMKKMQQPSKGQK